MLTIVTTFPELLARRLARDPASPFITFYDDVSDERTELSVTTYANWVSKTANLLTDELMLDPGDEIGIDLPVHWLGAIFLGAVSSAGLELSGEADTKVVGPDGLDTRATTVLATALLPFATRFREPLPTGVLDHGVLWVGQSDVFVPVAPSELGMPEPDGRRVISDVNPLSDRGTELLVGLLAGAGSLVLVANADERRWPARSQSERATAVLREGQPIS